MCSAVGIVLFFEQNEPSKDGCSNLFKTSSVAKIGSVSVRDFFRNSNVLYNLSFPYLILIFTTHASYPKKKHLLLLLFSTSDVSGRFLGIQRWPRPPSGRLQPLTVSAFWPFGGGQCNRQSGQNGWAIDSVWNDTESGILKKSYAITSNLIISYHFTDMIYCTPSSNPKKILQKSETQKW